MENSLEVGDRVKEQLLQDEGLRLFPYRDTVGELTIGVGRNLGDHGISREEAMLMLDNDVIGAMQDLDRNIPWWMRLHEDAQCGLANMCFNLGWSRLVGFKLMLAALERHDYSTASAEALDSKWAKQVGSRADRIAAIFLSLGDKT